MKFGLDLLFDSRAKFGQMQVEPSQKIKSNTSRLPERAPRIYRGKKQRVSRDLGPNPELRFVSGEC